MKISYEWLKDFIPLTEGPENVSAVLTQTGLEVEGLEKTEVVKGGMEGLVIGEVTSCEQHPNADKLKVTTVDIGHSAPAEIVCGAPNVAKGQKVVVAPVGTVIYPTAGDPFKIKKARIRGEVSEGMICAEDEIGLGASHEGVIVLDTDLPNGCPAKTLFDLGTDWIFEIGLTPNRGDGASHLGAARDLKAYYGRELTLPDPPPFRIESDRPISVEVANPKACPRYSGITIRGAKVSPSPAWLQNRLRSIGLEPINNIVDITNYTLHGLGQPLHAFDADHIQGEKVVVKTLSSKTKFTTLDEKERKLHADDLMICDGEGNGLCIAGVFGGVGSGVTEGTTNIFLESAHFSADWVRATSLRHGLSTDAAFRFERGTDPEITVLALKYATQLILELAGGKVASEIVDIYPDPIKPKVIKTKFRTFDRLIGEALPHDRIVNILHALDIQTTQRTETDFLATVPSYRSEVMREADLVEEVLRIYGFNNIALDEVSSTGFLAEFDELEPYNLQEELSHFLVGKGFFEMITNSITNEKYEVDLGLGKGNIVPLLNKSSEDLGIMKPSPLYTALESLRRNINRKRSNLRFFEFGKTYHKYGDDFDERPKLSLYLTGNQHEESWLDESGKSTYHELAGAIRDLLQKAGIGGVNSTPLDNDDTFQYGVKLKCSKKVLGRLGKIHPSIVRYFDVDQDVLCAMLEWDVVHALASRAVTFRHLSKYPEVRRDLSLVLDKSISYKEIEEISFNSEKKLLNRMNVFSVYEGEQIGSDKKAYAIAFYLQDDQGTLNDKQIDKCMNKLIHNFEKQVNATIRK